VGNEYGKRKKGDEGGKKEWMEKERACEWMMVMGYFAARSSNRPASASTACKFPFPVFSLLVTSVLGIMALRTNPAPMVEKINRGQNNLADVVKLPTPDNSDASESDQDSGVVDEEGLQNLVRALGEDGLNEFDLTQLRMLAGSPVDEESGEDDNAHSTNESEDIEQADAEEEEEGIALDDEDVDSVDEDAIPRRKVQVDNKVRPFHSLSHSLILTPMYRSRSNAYGTPLNSTHHFHGQKRWRSHTQRLLTST
jgi:hypothetical protein